MNEVSELTNDPVFEMESKQIALLSKVITGINPVSFAENMLKLA